LWAKEEKEVAEEIAAASKTAVSVPALFTMCSPADYQCYLAGEIVG